MTDRKTVVVVGGGVAGLSAAHMLVRRGFDVDLYERGDVLGGKARSLRVPIGERILPAEHGFRFFPGFYRHVVETMREIPTGDDAPTTGARTVADHLTAAATVGITQEGRPTLWVPARFPRSAADLGRWLTLLAHWRILGLTGAELRSFAFKLLNAAQMSDERRMSELETTSWWDYIDADAGSEPYRRLLGEGLTRSLVALKAREGNARTVSTILLQLFRYLVKPGDEGDRLFDRPTNDAWIDPWERYLTTAEHPGGARVRIFRRHQALKVLTGERSVRGVLVHEIRTSSGDVPGGEGEGRVRSAEPGGHDGPPAPPDAGDRIAEGDYYVLAVPIDAAFAITMQAFGDEPFFHEGETPLSGIQHLKVDWMNGIQYYLDRPWRDELGQTIHSDTAWALTTVSQRQFWTDVDFDALGVGGLLSVDISDWQTPGTETTERSAEQCTLEEIADEVWAQLCAARPDLEEVGVVAYHLDPAIEPGESLPDRPVGAGEDGPPLGAMGGFPAGSAGSSRPDGAAGAAAGATGGAPDEDASAAPPEGETAGATGGRGRTHGVGELGDFVLSFHGVYYLPGWTQNAEPLLVNTAGSWKHRPNADTVLHNFFLAADFVRTHTDLATMEAANEAARRAVNAILDREGSDADREPVWPLSESWLLSPLRWLDRRRHARGKRQLRFEGPWRFGLAVVGLGLSILGSLVRPFVPRPRI